MVLKDLKLNLDLFQKIMLLHLKIHHLRMRRSMVVFVPMVYGKIKTIHGQEKN